MGTIGTAAINPEVPSTMISATRYKMRADIAFRGCTASGSELSVQIAGDEPMVTVTGRTVTVDDPERRAAELYDITGRRIAISSGVTHSELTAPASGVYLLRIDGLPAKKLVIL